MTLEQLRGLPECLRPWQARAVLGVGREGLRALRELHPELVVRKCGAGKQGAWVYSKRAVLRLAKVDLT